MMETRECIDTKECVQESGLLLHDNVLFIG